MNLIIRIAVTELKSLFYSPIAWILLLIFGFQCGQAFTSLMEVYIMRQNLDDNSLDFVTIGIFGPPGGFFVQVIKKMYLYIPLLTMSLVSREISSGTIKLLYSSPVNIVKIVFGKYLSMMIYSLLMLVFVVFYMTVAIINVEHVDYPYLLTGLFGIYLLLCVYTSIGLFMSSLTSYQVVAALCTLAVFGFMENIGSVGQDISLLRDLTYYLSLSGRIEKFLVGIISTRDVVYYLTIIVVFLALTIVKLQTDRERVTSFGRAYRYLKVVLIGIVVICLSNIQALTAYLDATDTNSNTLTKTSQNLLKKMDKYPLEVTTYVNLLDASYFLGAPSSQSMHKNNDWEIYSRFKSDIKFKFVYYYDSTRYTNDQLARYHDHTLKQLAERMANVRKVNLADFKTPAEIRKIIDLRPEENRMILELKYGNRKSVVRIFDDAQRYPYESEISAGIQRLMVPPAKAGFLQGELERSISSRSEREYRDFSNELEKRESLINQGFDIIKYTDTFTKIDKDLSVLVIADPKKSFTGKQLNSLKNYIDQGGNLLVAGEPGKEDIINPLCAMLGTQLNKGELVQNNPNSPANLIYGKLTSTASGISPYLGFPKSENVYIKMTGAASLSWTESDFKVMPLAITGDHRFTWNTREKLVLDSGNVKFNPGKGDVSGKFPVMLALTRKNNGKEQRIIVSGDADFLSNYDISMMANKENVRFSNAIFNWFTNGKYPLDMRRPPSRDKKITLSESGFSVLQIATTYLFPALLIFAGALFLFKRRNK